MKDEHRMAIFRHREVLTYRANNLTEKVLFTVVQLIVGKKKAFFSLIFCSISGCVKMMLHMCSIFHLHFYFSLRNRRSGVGGRLLPCMNIPYSRRERWRRRGEENFNLKICFMSKAFLLGSHRESSSNDGAQFKFV